MVGRFRINPLYGCSCFASITFFQEPRNFGFIHDIIGDHASVSSFLFYFIKRNGSLYVSASIHVCMHIHSSWFFVSLGQNVNRWLCTKSRNTHRVFIDMIFPESCKHICDALFVHSGSIVDKPNHVFIHNDFCLS